MLHVRFDLDRDQLDRGRSEKLVDPGRAARAAVVHTRGRKLETGASLWCARCLDVSERDGARP